MTNRERTIISVAAAAHRAIEREAAANGEQPHEVPAASVRWHVEDAAGRDTRAEAFNAPRFVAAAIRQVEDFADVRRGWWA